MSTMYVCDRCGKPFKHRMNRNHFVHKRPKWQPAIKLVLFAIRDDWIETEFELCDSCRTSFNEWFGESNLEGAKNHD